MNSPLPEGKLPPDLLSELLSDVAQRDRDVLVPPGIGRDAAGLRVDEGQVAVATDPITFATDRLGTYAVAVNVNDVACLGCRPRWFTCDLLLPTGTEEAELRALWKELLDQLDRYGVQLIGGHTEVTGAVAHPVAAGQMIGDGLVDPLLNPERARPGDRVLIWQGAAIEGTALIARQRREDLLERFSAPEVDAMADLLDDPGICVWPFVEQLLPTEGLIALHDPTEGGVATALHELADAAGCGLEVDLGGIPVRPETAALSGKLDFDALGLLASGALLLVCRGESARRLRRRFDAEPLSLAGVLTEGDQRVLIRDGERTPLPRYPADELIRALEAARD